jgi:hypothetical protein
MKNYNKKFIIIGLIIGLIYSFSINYIFKHCLSKNPSFEILNVTETIDDRNVFEPDNAIEYSEEKKIYLDKNVEFFHKLRQNKIQFLAVFIFITYCTVDIIFYPEGRKNEGLLDVFKYKKMCPVKRSFIKNKINNLLLGLGLSIIFVLIGVIYF